MVSSRHCYYKSAAFVGRALYYAYSILKSRFCKESLVIVYFNSYRIPKGKGNTFFNAKRHNETRAIERDVT